MVRRGASNGDALQLRGGELDAAADRGAVGERAGQFQQLVAEFARRCRAVDHGPVDHELLRAETRPFDKADRNALMRAGADRVEHLRIGDRRGITLALQQEFRMIDAARDIGGQDEQQVDLLGGERRRDIGSQDQRGKRQHASDKPDHDCPPRHRPGRCRAVTKMLLGCRSIADSR